MFLSKICDISRFKNTEHLAAYIRMIPMCHSSGERSWTGDTTSPKHVAMRYNLIEAALVAIYANARYNHHIRCKSKKNH
ncbi:MAG: IS110 family transposase [Prevotella sp.]|nr:IS110 family transposase [Prevotella sp.]